MARRWISVDGQRVRVSERPDELGTYDLEWTGEGRRRSMTVSRADRSPLSDDQLAAAARAPTSTADAPRRTTQHARGVVRDWRADEGWGVIYSPQTPGGCWAHFSAVRVAGFAELHPGQEVELEWEAAAQDGYAHRAVRTWPRGAEPVEATVGSGVGVSTHLTLVLGAPPRTPAG